MTEKGIVKYEDRTGNEVQLSFNIVRNYLVTGKKELVTDQEIMYFMGICKARGLNPFAKDCYLIKYTPNESAAIITSVDYFRSRARCQEDFQGYNCGVIVQKPDGDLRYSNGLVLPGEKLIGGWFETTPKGWLHPFKLEVNLAGYIKKKSDGGITKFWSEDNQPTMIAKVAESQGLRKCWPNEFQGVYSAEEINSFDIIDLTPIPDKPISPPLEVVKEFDDLWRDYSLGKPDVYALHIQEYLTAAAEHNKKSIDNIKTMAAYRWEEFVKTFEKWVKKQGNGKKSAAPAQEDHQAQPASPEAKTNGNPQVDGKGPVAPITEDQIDRLETMGQAKGIQPIAVCPDHVKSIMDMTYDEAEIAIEKMAAS